MKKIILSLAFFIFSVVCFAQVNSATLNLQNNKLADAKSDIDKAILDAKDSTKARTWFVRGEIYKALAESLILSERNLDPDALTKSFEAYKKTMQLEQPKQKGKYKDAEKAIPTLYVVAINNAVVNYEAKKLPQAIKSLTLAERIIPNDTTSLIFIGQIAYEAEDYNTFLSYLDKTLQSKLSDNSKITTYAKSISIYRTKKDFSKAIEYLDKALVSYPKNKLLWQMGSEVYVAKQNTDQTIEFLKKAAVAIPDDAGYPYELGIAYYNRAADIMRESREKTGNMKNTKEKEALSTKYNDLAVIELKNAITPLEKADALLKSQKKPESLDLLDVMRICYNSLNMPEKEKVINDRMKALEKK
jgi:tetratricopeptide (TPR) repeat protein